MLNQMMNIPNIKPIKYQNLQMMATREKRIKQAKDRK